MPVDFASKQSAARRAEEHRRCLANEREDMCREYDSYVSAHAFPWFMEVSFRSLRLHWGLVVRWRKSMSRR